MLCHTFVTTMLDAGVDLRDVQIAARHADPPHHHALRPRPSEPRPPPQLHPGRLHGLRYLTKSQANGPTPGDARHCLICEVIVRRQDQEHCASITRMIRHYVARRAQVTEGHPDNAEKRLCVGGGWQPITRQSAHGAWVSCGRSTQRSDRTEHSPCQQSHDDWAGKENEQAGANVGSDHSRGEHPPAEADQDPDQQ
jgi:hypothetical protein